jgi:8-oxo-dGTP diphosphatase
MSEVLNEYVLGFLFDDKETKVALIEKQKPAWQKGFLNGIGGLIESKDIDACHLASNNAMAREFMEETGVSTYIDCWTHFCTMRGKDWVVLCYKQSNTKFLKEVRTMTKERVVIVPLKDLHKHKVLSNIHWLIPMALDKNMGNPPFFANVYY